MAESSPLGRHARTFKKLSYMLRDAIAAARELEGTFEPDRFGRYEIAPGELDELELLAFVRLARRRRPRHRLVLTLIALAPDED